MRTRKREDENRLQNVYLCIYINYISPRRPIDQRAASAFETPGPAGSSVLRANMSLARVAAFVYPFFIHTSCRPRARGPYADAVAVGGHTRGHAIVRPPGSTTTTTIPYTAASTAPTRRRQNACPTVPGDSRTHLFKHMRRGKK